MWTCLRETRFLEYADIIPLLPSCSTQTATRDPKNIDLSFSFTLSTTSRYSFTRLRVKRSNFIFWFLRQFHTRLIHYFSPLLFIIYSIPALSLKVNPKKSMIIEWFNHKYCRISIQCKLYSFIHCKNPIASIAFIS